MRQVCILILPPHQNLNQQSLHFLTVLHTLQNLLLRLHCLLHHLLHPKSALADLLHLISS